MHIYSEYTCKNSVNSVNIVNNNNLYLHFNNGIYIYIMGFYVFLCAIFLPIIIIHDFYGVNTLFVADGIINISSLYESSTLH